MWRFHRVRRKVGENCPWAGHKYSFRGILLKQRISPRPLCSHDRNRSIQVVIAACRPSIPHRKESKRSPVSSEKDHRGTRVCIMYAGAEREADYRDQAGRFISSISFLRAFTSSLYGLNLIICKDPCAFYTACVKNHPVASDYAWKSSFYITPARFHRKLRLNAEFASNEFNRDALGIGVFKSPHTFIREEGKEVVAGDDIAHRKAKKETDHQEGWRSTAEASCRSLHRPSFPLSRTTKSPRHVCTVCVKTRERVVRATDAHPHKSIVASLPRGSGATVSLLPVPRFPHRPPISRRRRRSAPLNLLPTHKSAVLAAYLLRSGTVATINVSGTGHVRALHPPNRSNWFDEDLWRSMMRRSTTHRFVQLMDEHWKMGFLGYRWNPLTLSLQFLTPHKSNAKLKYPPALSRSRKGKEIGKDHLGDHLDR